MRATEKIRVEFDKLIKRQLNNEAEESSNFVGLFPVFFFFLIEKKRSTSSKCYSLPINITCALPGFALLLSSVWAGFLQTSTYLICADMTMWQEGGMCKAVCHPCVRGIKILRFFQIPLVAACGWIYIVRKTWSLLNLARKLFGGGCVFFYCCWFSCLKTRFETSFCISQQLCYLLSRVAIKSSNECRAIKKDEGECLTSSACCPAVLVNPPLCWMMLCTRSWLAN